MRVAKWFGFLLLASSMMQGQTSGGSKPADAGNLADEVRQLREAFAAQQKQITQQQEQIEQLQQQLSARAMLGSHLQNAVLTSSSTALPVETAGTSGADQGEMEKPKESPLSFRIGGTEFTPGGFIDFENVFRTTNRGGSVGTRFGSIPFSNTVSGHLTE